MPNWVNKKGLSCDRKLRLGAVNIEKYFYMFNNNL